MMRHGYYSDSLVLTLERYNMRLLLIFIFALATATLAQNMTVEAYSGTPYGIGKCTVHSSGYQPSTSNSQLMKQNDRVLYPVVQKVSLASASPSYLSWYSNETYTIHFLFTGNEPLALSTALGEALPEAEVKPVANPER